MDSIERHFFNASGDIYLKEKKYIIKDHGNGHIFSLIVNNKGGITLEEEVGKIDKWPGAKVIFSVRGEHINLLLDILTDKNTFEF